MYLRVRFVVFIFALKVHYSKSINPVFSTIYKVNDPELFHSVRADTGGYGVVWNDELDISCDELFMSGKTLLAASGSADAALPRERDVDL